VASMMLAAGVTAAAPTCRPFIGVATVAGVALVLLFRDFGSTLTRCHSMFFRSAGVTLTLQPLI
jgi:hypothetical protein